MDWVGVEEVTVLEEVLVGGGDWGGVVLGRFDGTLLGFHHSVGVVLVFVNVIVIVIVVIIVMVLCGVCMKLIF